MFKKSNIFFKNQDDEVLFINKINSSKFYFDSNNLQNVLSMKSEVFNVPFKLQVKMINFIKNFLLNLIQKK